MTGGPIAGVTAQFVKRCAFRLDFLNIAALRSIGV
jgi:hypothetical protein